MLREEGESEERGEPSATGNVDKIWGVLSGVWARGKIAKKEMALITQPYQTYGTRKFAVPRKSKEKRMLM